MKPEIVEKDGFTLVGMKYEVKNENAEIPMLWFKFFLRLKEIKNRVNSGVSYGYDTWTEKINETGSLHILQVLRMKMIEMSPREWYV